MPTVDIGSITMRVLEEGRGMPLVFVHGFPLDHSMWRCQVEAFGGLHRVIAPDLRGFGGSGVTEGTVSMARHADDVAALLDALGIDQPVVFCGQSMGGYVGWEFFRRHRDRLRALVVCDSRAAADGDEARANRAKMVDNVLAKGPAVAAEAMLPKLIADATRSEQPTLVEELRRTMLATDPGGMAASLRGMAERPDSTGLLRSIDVPTLLLCGEADAITPPDEMEANAREIRGSIFETVPRAGHMAPLEQPAIVNDHLRSFLDRHA